MWNTLGELPRFLLFNLRYKSLISSGFDQQLANCLGGKLYTSHEISHRKNNFRVRNCCYFLFNADYSRGPGARFSKDPARKHILKSNFQEKKGVFCPLMKSNLFL